jgi:hypothetical protein
MTALAPSPALHLALLAAKAQETFPEHTYKAVIRRVRQERVTEQGRAEMLEGLIERGWEA